MRKASPKGPAAKAPAQKTQVKSNAPVNIGSSFTKGFQVGTGVTAGIPTGAKKVITPVTKKGATNTNIPNPKYASVDYSKAQSKATPVNKYVQESINSFKGNKIIPTMPGQMMSYAPTKSNPVSSNKGIASGPNQNMSAAPAPKAKANPTSLKNSSSIFEAFPGYSDPFGNIFKAPNYSNSLAGVSSAKGEQYQSRGVGKMVDPKTQRAMEAKLIASGQNGGANAEALREQLDSLGYDSSFIKSGYSNYNKNLLDANRMNQTNKLKGQNSDPETAKLLASFGNQSKTTQQKLSELSALLSRQGDKDAQKNAQILLSNLNATNQDVKDSYNIDSNKALIGAGVNANMPGYVAPDGTPKEPSLLQKIGNGIKDAFTPYTKEEVAAAAETAQNTSPYNFGIGAKKEVAPAAEPMMSSVPPTGTGTSAPMTYAPGIPNLAPKAETPTTPTTPAQTNTTNNNSGTGTSAGTPAAPVVTDTTIPTDATTPVDSTVPTDTATPADTITPGDKTTPFVAPNGKQYTLSIAPDGKVGFVNVNGDMQYLQNYDAAVGYINAKNPVGTKGGEANVLKNTQPGETPVVEADINSQDNNDLLTQQVEEYNGKGKEAVDKLGVAKSSVDAEGQKSAAAGDTNRSANMGILSTQFTGVTNLFSKIDGLVGDLAGKATELFDRGAMRSANARAQQMADKGYLTSDQVAQVANYSVADYKRDVDIKRVDVEQQIAQKKIDLAQTQEKMVQDIQANQMLTNDAKLAQINYVTKQFADVMSTFQDKEDQVKQFYDSQVAATQALAAQANVSANSIIQQDDATNQVQQNNKARAAYDDTARTNYILSRIPDQNLHRYAMQAIDTLIKNNKFMGGKMEAIAAAVASAANALQQRDLKALK